MKDKVNLGIHVLGQHCSSDCQKRIIDPSNKIVPKNAILFSVARQFEISYIVPLFTLVLQYEPNMMELQMKNSH